MMLIMMIVMTMTVMVSHGVSNYDDDDAIDDNDNDNDVIDHDVIKDDVIDDDVIDESDDDDDDSDDDDNGADYDDDNDGGNSDDSDDDDGHYACVIHDCRCRHFESLGSPLCAIHSYPTVVSHVIRYLDKVVETLSSVPLQTVYCTAQPVLIASKTCQSLVAYYTKSDQPQFQLNCCRRSQILCVDIIFSSQRLQG